MKNKQKFKCNHCGYEQEEENYNPLDLYDCRNCGKLTAEIEGEKLK